MQARAMQSNVFLLCVCVRCGGAVCALKKPQAIHLTSTLSSFCHFYVSRFEQIFFSFSVANRKFALPCQIEMDAREYEQK